MMTPFLFLSCNHNPPPHTYAIMMTPFPLPLTHQHILDQPLHTSLQATMQLFLKMARSKFELPVSSLTLAPGDSFDVNINANLDDSVVIKEELHVLV